MSGASFRPITDVWILARPKVRYYGAYPSGFMERARALLGVSIFDPVLHVCGGMVKDYPFRGVGPNDKTIDLDPNLKPDFQFDVRRLGVHKGDTYPFPTGRAIYDLDRELEDAAEDCLWPGVMADPPYSELEAKNYKFAYDAYPDRNDLLRRCLECVGPSRRVGWLDFMAPRPPNPKRVGFQTRLVAMISVVVGFCNQARLFTVYEREDVKLGRRERKRALAAVRGKLPKGRK